MAKARGFEFDDFLLRRAERGSGRIAGQAVRQHELQQVALICWALIDAAGYIARLLQKLGFVRGAKHQRVDGHSSLVCAKDAIHDIVVRGRVVLGKLRYENPWLQLRRRAA